MSSRTRAFRQLRVLATLLLLNGCASVVGYRDTTTESILARQVIPRKTSSRIVVAAENWIGNRSLTVSLQREWQCADAVQETVSVQRVRLTDTNNIGLDIGLGIVGLVAGSVALAVSPSLSTQQTTDYNGNASSSHDEAIGLGALGLAGGIVLIGNGLRTHLQGRPQVLSTSRIVRDRQSERRAYQCGTAPVFDGTVTANVNERSVALDVTRKGNTLTIAARDNLDEACGSGLSVHDSARIIFHPTDDPSSEVSIATFPLSDCVNAAEARAHLRRAKFLLNQAEGSTLLEAIDHVRQSEKNWRLLAQSDRDAPEIRTELDSMHKEVDASVEKVGAEPGSLLPKGHFSADDLIREASAALVLAAQNPHSARAWSAVMKWVVAHVDDGAPGYLQLVSIVKRANLDECLINGWQCPAWLTTETIETALQSETSQLTRLLGAQSKQLLATSHALQQKVSLKDIENAEAAQAAAATWTEACAPEKRLQLAALQTSCNQLGTAALEVTKAIETNAETVARLKEETEKRQHSDHERKALRDWRGQFAKCRKLRNDLAKVEQLRNAGRCGEECETGGARMQKEVRRLSEFQGDNQLDPADLEVVQRECEAAGCSTCPERSEE